MSFLVDNGAYRASERKKAAVSVRIESFPDRMTEFEILDPLAKEPTIFNERIDHCNGGPLRSWHGVPVFCLKDGKFGERTMTRSHSTGRRRAY
jgi:hypothetical protein